MLTQNNFAASTFLTVNPSVYVLFCGEYNDTHTTTNVRGHLLKSEVHIIPEKHSNIMIT